jgi:S1-C subfamily serine protease
MLFVVLASLVSTFSGAENYAVAVLSPTTFKIKASAFLVNEQIALTAAHAVKDVGSVQPMKCGRDLVFGIVSKRSQAADLALVEFAEPCGVAVARPAEADPARGAPLTVVGWPGGAFLLLTQGTVSAYEQIMALGVPRYALLTDAAIYHGNSGGPVFNDAGQVVGVVTGRVCFDDEDQPPQCYGSLVPISQVRLFLLL